MPRLSRFLIFTAALLASPAMATSVLGSAADFAALAGSTITNTGVTTVRGDLGVFPGSAITGLATVTQVGSVHLGDAAAQAAQTDAATALALLAALPTTTDLTGIDLGSVGALTPGVYSFASSAQLTGMLVLDFASNPDGWFVFKVGSALTTATGSQVMVLNGGARSGLFFAVGSSATLGTGTRFAGNILADQSITFGTGSAILGRAIARVGAVTLNGGALSNDGGAADFGSKGFSGAAASVVPEPMTWMMLVAGFYAVGGGLRLARRRAATIVG